MGKAMPVKLSTGKSWPTKGKANAYFSEMLGRYVDGQRVLNEEDHADLAALLAVYDAVLAKGQPTKAGVGIACFERDLDLEHPGNSSCFHVVRRDGTKIDFSLGRAVDAAAKPAA